MKKLKGILELKYLCVVLNIFIIFSYEKSIFAMPTESPEMPTEEGVIPVADEATQTPQPTATAGGTQELDTVSKTGEQGNWVKKKNWLLKSYEVNNNIYNLAIQIEQTKKIYKEKYQSIDTELDQFYKDLGIQQGKLQEMFDSVERYLEKKKKKDVLEMTSQVEKLNESEKEFRKKMEILETQIAGMKDELKQLGLNMEAISDVDKSLTTRLQKVDEQITLAMTNAESAKTKVESLWDIIDDKKAREIYYEVLNIENNLKAILEYLKDVLAKDFDNVVQTTKTQIANANSSIKTLESKGVIVKDRSRRVEQIKIAELQKIDLEATQQKQEAPVVVAPKEQQIGLVQKIYNLFISTFAKIYVFISNLFSKKAPSAKQAQQQQTSALDSTIKIPQGQETQITPSIPNLPTSPSALPNQSQNTPSFPVKIPTMPLAE